MMNGKIDESLHKIATLSLHRPINCLVYTSNMLSFQRIVEKRRLGRIVALYPFIRACEMEVDNQNLQKVAQFGVVEYMTSSTKVATCMHVAKKVMQLDEFSYHSNFTCAVIDTGCDAVVDLSIPKKNVVHFVDLIGNKEQMYDDNGHGTMVTSAITSNGTLSGGKYSGSAKGTPCVVIKALDKNGETSSFTILKAMQWVIDHKEEYNIRVVCMSFGSFPLEKLDPLAMGAEVLWDNGIVVVTACGNSGPGLESVKSPGISTKIITVGAMDDARIGDNFDPKRFTVAEFSSRGPAYGNYKPDLIASGVEVYTSCAYHLHRQHFSTMSGTSIATPIVVGVVCRMLQENPRLTPDMVKRILITHCKPITHDRNAEGYGYLTFQ